MPSYSHFPLSISSAASVDHLSKCQMATSATVGIKNSFLVGTTETVRWGERVAVEVGGPGLTLQFSCVSGSEEKEDDV